MAAPDDTAAFGSFEWAKKIVTDANAGVLAMSKPIEGSAQLGQPLRSRERAALDIAVRELVALEAAMQGGYRNTSILIRETLDKIAALVPEAVPHDIHGEPMRNTDRRP